MDLNTSAPSGSTNEGAKTSGMHTGLKILIGGVLIILVLAVAFLFWNATKTENAVEVPGSVNIQQEQRDNADVVHTEQSEVNQGLKNLPNYVVTNNNFISWFEAKKVSMPNIGEFRNYLKDSKLGLTKQSTKTDAEVCGSAGLNISPDANRVSCIVTSPEGVKEIWVYHRSSKVSGLIERCRTCFYDNEYWLDNDRLLFLTDYEDKELADPNAIVVQVFDFRTNLVNAWSAVVK